MHKHFVDSKLHCARGKIVYRYDTLLQFLRITKPGIEIECWYKGIADCDICTIPETQSGLRRMNKLT